MSVTIETIITCDGDSPRCVGTYCDGDVRSLSAKQQRDGFSNNDWHIVDGNDICPRCYGYLMAKKASKK
jgi:hypothetical protein